MVTFLSRVFFAAENANGGWVGWRRFKTNGGVGFKFQPPGKPLVPYFLKATLLKSANPRAGSAQTPFILSHDVSSHTRLLLPCGHVTGHADYYIHLEEPTIQRFCIGGYIHEYLGSICGGLGVVIS